MAEGDEPAEEVSSKSAAEMPVDQLKKKRTKLRAIVSTAYNKSISNREFDTQALLDAADQLEEIDQAFEQTDTDRDIYLAHDYRRKLQEIFAKANSQTTAAQVPSQQPVGQVTTFNKPKLPAYEPPIRIRVQGNHLR